MTTSDRHQLGPPEPFAASVYAAALACARVGVWRHDLTTGELRWSAECGAIAGQPAVARSAPFDECLRFVHPEDAALIGAQLQAVVGGPASGAGGCADYELEHRLLRDDGTVVWVEVRGRVERGAAGEPLAITGTMTDVTERRLAVEQLRRREEEQRLAAELATDYVYAADLTETGVRTRVVAGSFERTTGYTVAELDARGGWPSVFHPDDRPRLMQLLDQLLRGHAQVNEYRIVRADGEARWLRDVVRPILDDAGRVVRFVGGATDITERRRLEEELLQARKLEAIGRISGAVAHDFNNLLGVVLSGVDVLASRHPGVAGDPDLDAIRGAAVRGGELARALLTAGRRQPGTPQTFDCEELLRAAVPMIEHAIGERISVVVRVSASAAVRIDPTQAHLLLLNLAINARDAMPSGGVFTLACAVVEPGAAPGRGPAGLGPGPFVVIEASDDGLGIPEEVLPHVFEPFFTTKAEGAGAGLGLATCYGVAASAGGTMTAESRPGAGATFRVYLPVAVAAEEQPPATAVVSVPAGTERVLVVEDGAQLRRLAQRILAGRGYDVKVAGTASEAVAEAERMDRLDVVVADVGLPDGLGTELAARITRRRPTVRVLLMSGNPSDEATRRAIDGGVPFLQKPFGASDLAGRVREVLDAAPSAHECALRALDLAVGA
ncbi:MAG: PAS domain-containing protein [Polyangiaceae bacterium]|nr:PAS domain-containing protein [Polyangiaceae bacterium]